ncbi:MAG TPA: hypothetical protein VLK56_10495 [Solirubrobacterales bacterium]|nr:hypothetical protein [Solirubrobacterales bacterium]
MIRELLSPETGLAFAAMQALRGDLADEQPFADAHRLYLNAGLLIAAHHFARYVEP